MRIAIVLALALLTTACPFSDDDGDPNNHVAISEIGVAYKAAYCTYLARCGIFPDQATCIGAALQVVPTIDPNIEAAIGAGRVIYNGSNVKECFDAVANDTCDQTDENGRVRVPACGQYFHGTLADGDECLLDQECISQQCVGGDTGTSCQRGACLGDEPPTVQAIAIGQQCSTTVGCVDGAYCEGETDVCTALKPSGSACTQNNECGYGLGCAGTTGARTCKPLPALGEPCPDSVCRDEGTFCSSSTATCTQVGLPPSACTSSSQCSQYYPCDFDTGMCKRGPELGQPCSASNRCFAAGTYCDTSTFTCVARKIDGMPCTNDLECESDYCDQTAATAVCASPLLCF